MPGEGLTPEAAAAARGLREARDLLVELRHELLRVDGGASESLADLPKSLRRASTVARASTAIRAIEDALAPVAPKAAPPADALESLRRALAAKECLVTRLLEEHPDPVIAAQVRAEKAARDEFDAAHGIEVGWHKGDPCPTCGHAIARSAPPAPAAPKAPR